MKIVMPIVALVMLAACGQSAPKDGEAKVAAAAAADPVTPFSFDEFVSNSASLRGVLRSRPPSLACQARNLLDPDLASPCPVPVASEIR